MRIRPVQTLLMAGDTSEKQAPNAWMTVGGKGMPPAGVSRQFAVEAHWVVAVTGQLNGAMPSLLVMTSVAFLVLHEEGVKRMWNATQESGLTVSGLPAVGEVSTR